MKINKAWFIKFAGLFFFASLVLFACSEDSTNVEKPKAQLHLKPSATRVTVGQTVYFRVKANDLPLDADIYIDGSRINGFLNYTFNEIGDHTAIAKKQGYLNSQEVKIHVDTGIHSVGNAMFISEGDVYVAGSVFPAQPPSRPTPVYWKNGNGHKLNYAPATATSIFVSNGNVYIAGYDTYPLDSNGGIYWKNGDFHVLDNTSTVNYPRANSIFVNKDDIYIAGTKGLNKESVSLEAVYWKNENPHVLAAGANVSANSVYVSDGDIYVAGGNRDTVMYWKNQNPHYLTNNGQAYAITVSDGNVYVAGSHDDAAAYWLNGMLHELSDHGKVTAIFIYEGNMYMAGNMEDKAVYWKNGDLYTLTDHGKANAIYVANGDIYVAGSETHKATYWKNGTAHKLEDVD